MLNRTLFCLLILVVSIPSSAQDFEAVERRLGEAVADGEINLKQATTMMEALRRGSSGEANDRIEQRLESAAQRLKEAVKGGWMSEQSAKEKWAEMHMQAKMAAVRMRIRNAVEQGAISDSEARQKMQAVERELKNQWQKKKDWIEAVKKEWTEKPRSDKESQDRDEKEESRDESNADGLSRRFQRLGVSQTMLARITNVLEDNGLDADQVDGALGGMVRAIYSMKNEKTADAKLTDDLVKYLEEEVGLEVEQIEQIEGMCQRVTSQLLN